MKKDLEFKGVIVTDDFSMAPIVESDGGIESASKQALDAGVDYVLISYDTDLFYKAMKGLLEGE